MKRVLITTIALVIGISNAFAAGGVTIATNARIVAGSGSTLLDTSIFFAITDGDYTSNHHGGSIYERRLSNV